MAVPLRGIITRPANARGAQERHFLVERVLGVGTFGIVYKVSDQQTHHELALKQMRLAQEAQTDKERMVFEVSVLARLRHPHIVSYEDAWQTGETLYLLMELCPDTDVHTYLQGRRDPNAILPEPQFLDWLAQIASGLQYLHAGSEGRPVILHRDVRPKNILVLLDPEVDPKSDKKILKLADFGVAKEVSRQESIAASIVGAPHFFSPEMVVSNQNGYTCKTDIWSFGITAYYIATLREAIATLNSTHLVDILRDFVTPQIDTNYRESTKTLIKSMLSVDQSHRPSADDVVRALDRMSQGEAVDWNWQRTAEGVSVQGVSFIVHESKVQPSMPFALYTPQSDDDTSSTLTTSVRPPRTEADNQRDLRQVLRQLSDDASKDAMLREKIKGVNIERRQSDSGTGKQTSSGGGNRQFTVSSDWIWDTIREYQTVLVEKMGEAKFRETYECLGTHDERKLLRELLGKLGDSGSSLLPYFLALKMLEGVCSDSSVSTLKR